MWDSFCRYTDDVKAVQWDEVRDRRGSAACVVYRKSYRYAGSIEKSTTYTRAHSWNFILNFIFPSAFISYTFLVTCAGIYSLRRGYRLFIGSRFIKIVL